MVADQQNLPLAPRGASVRARLWDGLLPDAIGLGLLCVMLLSGLGVGLLADRVAKRAVHDAARTGAQIAAEMVAQAWALAANGAGQPSSGDDGGRDDGGDGPRTTAASPPTPAYAPPAALARRPLHSIYILDAQGAVRAGWSVQSSGGFLGLPATDAPAARPGLLRCTAALPGAGGGGQVLVLAEPRVEGARAWVLGAAAGVQGLVLLAYWLLYRRLRRHVAPMAAVQRNLRALAAGVERNLLALSLSDSFGQVAEAWNGLMRQVTSAREASATPEAGELARQAVERFESQTLRRMLDRLPVGVLRCRNDEQIIYANVSAAQLLGMSPEALAERRLTEVLDEEVARPLIGAFRRGASGEPIDRQSGEGEKLTTLRFRLAPRSARGGDSELVITVEDVTHIRDAERARDNFLYHVTHELRTPLTNIHAYAETLSRPDFDDETTRRECYNVIISETRRLSNLVEDILSVSQLEVGSIRLELSDVDILKLMRTMVQDNLGKADEKGVDLQLTLPPKAPKLRGDKQRLAILVSNLVGNAIKYTPQGGRVEVALEVGDDAVRICVADTGVGISEEDQKHVFEKFYRAADEGVQAVSGTGLGLAIAREIARLHGGDIRVESVLSKGSTFTVELPVAASVAAA